MKKEYDFSKGERGKFYAKDAVFELPIYLEPDIAEIIQQYANKKKIGVSQLVNEWLRSNVAVIQSVA